MWIGEGWQSAMYLKYPYDLVFWYQKYVDKIVKANKHDRVLMLGGGGFSYPQHFVVYHKGTIDVVEISPEVIDTAKTQFGLDRTLRLYGGINVICEDARAYLERTEEKYDIVIVDAFIGRKAIHIEPEALKRVLNEGGLVITNITEPIEQRPDVLCDHATIKMFENGGVNVIAEWRKP